MDIERSTGFQPEGKWLVDAHFTVPESLVAANAIRFMDQHGGAPAVTTDARDDLLELGEILDDGTQGVSKLPCALLHPLSMVLRDFALVNDFVVSGWQLEARVMERNGLLKPFEVTVCEAYRRRARTMIDDIGAYLLTSPGL